VLKEGSYTIATAIPKEIKHVQLHMEQGSWKRPNRTIQEDLIWPSVAKTNSAITLPDTLKSVVARCLLKTVF